MTHKQQKAELKDLHEAQKTYQITKAAERSAHADLSKASLKELHERSNQEVDEEVTVFEAEQNLDKAKKQLKLSKNALHRAQKQYRHANFEAEKSQTKDSLEEAQHHVKQN